MREQGDRLAAARGDPDHPFRADAPAESSSVMEYYIFENGFENGAIGIACAAVVVLLLIACMLIAFYLRLRARAMEADG